MKKNKKKIVASIVAVVLLLVSVVGTTLAWFTDSTENVKNTFTMGNVDIILYESENATIAKQLTQAEATNRNNDYADWLATANANGQPGNGLNLVPGSTVAKYAFIENIGTVDAWIGATYAIPAAIDGTDVINTDPDVAEVGTLLVHSGIEVTVNTTDWELGGVTTIWGDDDGLTYNVYSYVLTEKLAAGEQAPAFITKVDVEETVGNDFLTILNGLAGTTDIKNDFNVFVQAYAVQEPELTVNNAKAALQLAFSDRFHN